MAIDTPDNGPAAARQPSGEARRYPALVIALHWLIAIGILSMIPLGWAMGEPDLPAAERFALFQIHKSVGLTILLLSFGRLAVRLLNPPPALPADMTAWERLAAHAVHWTFYVFMIAVPLSGWMMVSASPTGVPTLLFGVVPWPHLPFLGGLSDATKKLIHGPLEFLHSKGAWVFIVLTVMHVGAALKHQFFDHQNILGRMIPLIGRLGRTLLSPRAGIAAAVIVIGGFLLGAGLGGLNGASAKPPASDSAAPAVADRLKAPADVTRWEPDYAVSTVTFIGRLQGADVPGKFDSFSAQIAFDPTRLSESQVDVEIDMTKVGTGNPYYDGSLPEADWFNAAGYPKARFVTDRIEARDDKNFAAFGRLTIKNIEKPVVLPFSLVMTGDTAEMHGSLTLNRFDFALGAQSDPDQTWIDQQVTVNVSLIAKKHGG